MTNVTLDPKDGRRPLYYENFEGRVRNFCQRNVNNEFTDIELRAITYDYLNVVYRGLWKADERYVLHERALKESQTEVAFIQTQKLSWESKAETYQQIYYSTLCYKLKTLLKRFNLWFGEDYE